MIRSTTVICIRHQGRVVCAGDGQVTMGQTVLKATAQKIRRLHKGAVLAGFAYFLAVLRRSRLGWGLVSMREDETAAACLGCDSDYLQKTRLSGTEVSMAPKEVAVKGRDVVIFDDMIATGGTMAMAISFLRQQGARRVFLAAVHPVLTGSAILKLYRSGVEAVLSTDTLDKGVSTVSVAPLIARALRQ